MRPRPPLSSFRQGPQSGRPIVPLSSHYLPSPRSSTDGLLFPELDDFFARLSSLAQKPLIFFPLLRRIGDSAVFVSVSQLRTVLLIEAYPSPVDFRQSLSLNNPR